MAVADRANWSEVVEQDPFGAEVALRAAEPLAAFNRAGVLAAADIHVARTLCSLAGIAVEDPVAVRCSWRPRSPCARPGSGTCSLTCRRSRRRSPSRTRSCRSPRSPWPDVCRLDRVVSAATELVAVGEDETAEPRPLRLLGSRLYLDRYWREERALARALAALAATPLRERRTRRSRRRGRPDLLRRRRRSDAARSRGQRGAARADRDRRGTGNRQDHNRGPDRRAARRAAAASSGSPPPLVALCAPTGKAAARLQEAVHEEADRADRSPTGCATSCGLLQASTIHRLLARLRLRTVPAQRRQPPAPRRRDRR